MKFYKNTNIIITSLVITAFGLSFTSTTSFAEAQTLQERRAEIESRIESIREQASTTRSDIHEALEEGDVDQVCSVITERVNNRLESFVSTHNTHEEAYNTHVETLTKISSKLQSQGLDVTDLNSNIAVLEVKISKFKADKETVVLALEATKEFSCGNSDGEFRESVQAAREAQKILLSDVGDILSFIKTAIKKDLENLREQYKQIIS
jgi:phage shock protein A